jgi:hypothetical protein
MKTKTFFLALFCAVFSQISCDKIPDCSDPLNTLCPDNCSKTAHKISVVWNHFSGTGVFTIIVTFDKDIDPVASGFANRNGIVVYQRLDQNQATEDGTSVTGTISGAGKVWTFRSDALAESFILDPLNFFEIAIENNGSDNVGVRTTDGGVFDADLDCGNLTSEYREFYQF